MPLGASIIRLLGNMPRVFLKSSVLLVAYFAVSTAQVTTNITPDGTLGTAVTQEGSVYDITGGTRPGDGPNLFHSFDRFRVGTNDTARFAGQPGVDNIISRVTGGAESMIDGHLASEATLFLLNPSGVMFGPNATLDVNGSFHVSTADVLRFADGAAFAVSLSETSTLTVAAPAAFGFLQENPAPMTIAGSHLQVPEGERLSVIGGDLVIQGDLQSSRGVRPTLGAAGCRGACCGTALGASGGYGGTPGRDDHHGLCDRLHESSGRDGGRS